MTIIEVTMVSPLTIITGWQNITWSWIKKERKLIWTSSMKHDAWRVVSWYTWNKQKKNKKKNKKMPRECMQCDVMWCNVSYCYEDMVQVIWGWRWKKAGRIWGGRSNSGVGRRQAGSDEGQAGISNSGVGGIEQDQSIKADLIAVSVLFIKQDIFNIAWETKERDRERERERERIIITIIIERRRNYSLIIQLCFTNTNKKTSKD